MAFSLGDTLSNETLESMRVGEHSTVQDTLTTHHVVHNTTLSKGCILARYNETEYLPWDNPDNIASQDVVALVSKIKDLTLGFLFLIGGPANVLNMIVLYKQGLEDRVNLCLLMLAVSDNLYLTSGFCLHWENMYWYLSVQVANTAVKEFMANNLTVFMGSGFLSFILSAILACETCYCVLRPLKYHTLMRTRTMAVIILVASVSMLGVFYMVSYRYWVQCVWDPVTGAVLMMTTGGGMYTTHKTLIDYLDMILFGAGVPGGMMVVVITATITTTVKLRRIMAWRTKTSSSSLSAREVALTKMLIGNSVLFIVCLTPACVFRLACLFVPGMRGGGRHHNFYITTLWVLEGSTLVNSTYNFFIYYTMGSRYRETLWALFDKKTHQRKGKN